MAENPDQRLLNAVLQSIVDSRLSAEKMNSMIRDKRNIIQKKWMDLNGERQNLINERNRLNDEKSALSNKLEQLQKTYSTIQAELSKRQEQLQQCYFQDEQNRSRINALQERINQLLGFLHVNGPFMQELQSVKSANSKVIAELDNIYRDLTTENMSNFSIEDNSIYNYRNMMMTICKSTSPNTKSDYYRRAVAKLFKLNPGPTLCDDILNIQKKMLAEVNMACRNANVINTDMIVSLNGIREEEVFAIPKPLFAENNLNCFNILDLLDHWKQQNQLGLDPSNSSRLPKYFVMDVIDRLVNVAKIVDDDYHLTLLNEWKLTIRTFPNA